MRYLTKAQKENFAQGMFKYYVMILYFFTTQAPLHPIRKIVIL